jgi:prepilin-type N-terminal cleavage/methylation domain-containing protein
MSDAHSTVHTRRPRHGFSLVELLVVIGVISILIGLLLPVVGKARRQAQQVACLSNLRQVGAAFLAYAQEHRGYFPAPANGIKSF